MEKKREGEEKMSWKGQIKEMKDLETPEDDPGFGKAMQDIIKIMQEAKIGGTVFLISKTHARYAYEFPKWSSCSIGTKGKTKGMLRMRCKREEYKTQADFGEALELMAHFLCQCKDLNENAAETFKMAVASFKEFLEIEEEPRKEKDD